MCKALKIYLWPLSRGNHKGLSVEKYPQFLKKTQKIMGQDRGTHLSILKMPKIPDILGTDVSQSLAAVGREFLFPLDIEISAIPELNDKSNSTLYNYL